MEALRRSIDARKKKAVPRRPGRSPWPLRSWKPAGEAELLAFALRLKKEDLAAGRQLPGTVVPPRRRTFGRANCAIRRGAHRRVAADVRPAQSKTLGDLTAGYLKWLRRGCDVSSAMSSSWSR